jgi:predicted membrane protein
MKTTIENNNVKHNSKTILGAIIIVIGTVLLVDQFNLIFIPGWLFSWPMILILIGLYSGAKHNFQNLSWIIWIFIGGAFLADDAFPGLNIDDFVWPAGLVAFGLYLILRHGDRKRQRTL